MCPVHPGRALGLTETEIAELLGAHAAGRDISARLAEVLDAARARLDARAAGLAAQRRRLEEFQARHRVGLTGSDGCPLAIDAGSVA